MNRRTVLARAAAFAAAGLGSLAAGLRPAFAQALWSDCGTKRLVRLNTAGGSQGLKVQLPSAAPVDTIVYLTVNSTGPSASVPSSVIVPAGLTSADYTLTYGTGTTSDSVTVNLAANGGQDTGSTTFNYA